MRKKLLVLSALVCALVLVFGCSGETSATLSEIKISTAPQKTAYIVGETFDASGMVITASYDDSTSKAVTDYTIDKTGALTLEDTEITISYTEGEVTKTAVQEITVSPILLTGITISTAPTRLNYFTGSLFSNDGMVVLASYNNQSSKAVTDYTIDKTGALTLEDAEITISYTEGEVTKTAVQEINVSTAPADVSNLVLMIDNLPNPSVYSTYEKPLIDYLQSMYDGLSADEKYAITNYSKLAEAVAIMESLIENLELTIRYVNFDFNDFTHDNPEKFKPSTDEPFELLPAYSQTAEESGYEFKYWKYVNDPITHLDNTITYQYPSILAVFEKKRNVRVRILDADDDEVLYSADLARYSYLSDYITDIKQTLEDDSTLLEGLYLDKSLQSQFLYHNDQGGYLQEGIDLYAKLYDCFVLTLENAGEYSVWYIDEYNMEVNAKPNLDSTTVKIPKGRKVSLGINYYMSQYIIDFIIDGTDAQAENINSYTFTPTADAVIKPKYELGYNKISVVVGYNNNTMTLVIDKNTKLSEDDIDRILYYDSSVGSGRISVFTFNGAIYTFNGLKDIVFTENSVIVVSYIDNYYRLILASPNSNEYNNSYEIYIEVPKDVEIRECVEAYSTDYLAILENCNLYTDLGRTQLFDISRLDGYLTEDLILYASDKNYTVSFDAKGGNAVKDIQIGYNATSAIPKATGKDGYFFKGWSFTDGGDIISEQRLIYWSGKDLTLIAVWEQLTAHNSDILGYWYASDYSGRTVLLFFNDDGSGYLVYNSGKYEFSYTRSGDTITLSYDWNATYPTKLDVIDDEGIYIEYFWYEFRRASENELIEVKITIRQYFESAYYYFATETDSINDLHEWRDYEYYIGKDKINPDTPVFAYLDGATSLEIDAYYFYYGDLTSLTFIEFELNGGEMDIESSFVVGYYNYSYNSQIHGVSFSDCVPEKSGYVFAGWYDETGEIKYSEYDFRDTNKVYYARYISLSELDYTGEAFVGEWYFFGIGSHSGYGACMLTYALKLNADGSYEYTTYANMNLTSQASGYYGLANDEIIFLTRTGDTYLNINRVNMLLTFLDYNMMFMYSNYYEDSSMYNGNLFIKDKVLPADYSETDLAGTYSTYYSLKSLDGTFETLIKIEVEAYEDGRLNYRYEATEDGVWMGANEDAYYRVVGDKIWLISNASIQDITDMYSTMKDGADFSGHGILGDWVADDIMAEMIAPEFSFDENGVVKGIMDIGDAPLMYESKYSYKDDGEYSFELYVGDIVPVNVSYVNEEGVESLVISIDTGDGILIMLYKRPEAENTL